MIQSVGFHTLANTLVRTLNKQALLLINVKIKQKSIKNSLNHLNIFIVSAFFFVGSDKVKNTINDIAQRGPTV